MTISSTAKPTEVCATSRSFDLLLLTGRAVLLGPIVVRTAKRALFRGASGLRVVLAFLVTYGAVVNDNTQCIAIVYWAFLHVYTTLFLVSVWSFEGFILFTAIYVSKHSFTLYSILYISESERRCFLQMTCAVAVTFDFLSFGTSVSEENLFPLRAAVFGTYSLSWTSLLLAVPMSSYLLNLALLCYRFDYSIARSALCDGEAIGLALEKVNPESGEIITEEDAIPCENTQIAVHIPSCIETSFAKPYYYTALATWLCTNFLFIALSPTHLRIHTYTLVFVHRAALTALPMMHIAVIFLAVMKGQFKLMWTYTENWAEDPTANASKALIISVDNKEPLLPTCNSEKGSV